MAVQTAVFLTDKVDDVEVTFAETTSPDALPSSALQAPLVPGASLASLGLVRGDLEGKASGNEGNTLCTSAAPLKEGCVTLWRFKGLTAGNSGDFTVGISTKDSFKSSWGIRGMFQRSQGNLCGRGSLKCGWASNYRSDSTVDWYVELKNNVVQVYPTVDGQIEGLAFKLDFTGHTNLIPELRPAVCFTDGAKDLKVALIEFSAIPIPSAPGYASAPVAPRTSPEGYWSLDVTSWTGLVMPEEGIHMTIAGPRLSLKVINSMNTTATFNSDGTATVDARVVSTMMMPPPAFVETEKTMAQFLPTIKTYKVENNKLILNGKVVFIPGDKKGGPVTDNVFTETF